MICPLSAKMTPSKCVLTRASTPGCQGCNGITYRMVSVAVPVALYERLIVSCREEYGKEPTETMVQDEITGLLQSIQDGEVLIPQAVKERVMEMEG